MSLLKQTKVSKYFTLSEMLTSEKEWFRDYIPTSGQVRNAVAVILALLAPLREAARQKLVITSGIRSERLNSEVGGSKTSQHLKGEAADFCFPEIALGESLLFYLGLIAWARKNISFGELILYLQDDGKTPRFIHISLPTLKENGQALVNCKGVYIPLDEWLGKDENTPRHN